MATEYSTKIINDKLCCSNFLQTNFTMSMRAWTEIGLVWILHILWSNISHSFSTFPTIFVGNKSQRLNNFIYQLQQARMAHLVTRHLAVRVQTPHRANRYEKLIWLTRVGFINDWQKNVINNGDVTSF